MTEKETTSGGALWRKRAVATVGVAAAVAAGGVALASAAYAANMPPTLTVTAPTTIVNDGSATATPLSIRVNNTGTGAGVPVNPPNTDTLQVTLTAPSGLLCSNITLTPQTASPSSVSPAPASPALTTTSTSGTCVFNSPPAGFSQDINSDVTYRYGITVQGSGNASATPPIAGVTGTITSQAALRELTVAPNPGAGNTVSLVTSNTASSSLVSPTANTAATFATTAPPAATIYLPYTFTEATSVGTPASTFKVFYTDRVPDATSGTYLAADTGTRTNTFGLFDSTTDTTAEAGLSLNVNNSGASGFYFDTVTGKIAYYTVTGGALVVGTPSATDSTPDLAFTLIANNGTGGYNPTGGVPATVPGVGPGSQTQPTPTVGLHDVLSPKFSLQVLFSDVTTASTFGSSIYDLSDLARITGFADGTFRPAQNVTRQEFVQILNKAGQGFGAGGFLGTGECSTIDPSAFSDVPNSSIFCESIKRLSQLGIVKGTGNGKFNPSAQVSREQIAGFLYRAYTVRKTGSVANDATFTSPSPFSDVTASNVFAGDIEFLAGKKIISGFSDGTFHPKAAANRGSTAALIDRTINAAL